MKQQITNIALDMIRESGLINLSRRGLCERAGIADGSFPHIMGMTFGEFVNKLKKQIIEDKKITHIVFKSRTDPTLRKAAILNSALITARAHGYDKMTRDQIAECAGVSVGLITRYFGTMINLKRTVMRTAIHFNVLEIIAQGLVAKDAQALKLPQDKKNEALKFISEV